MEPFNFTVPSPVPYIPRAPTFEVPECVSSAGEIYEPLDEDPDERGQKRECEVRSLTLARSSADQPTGGVRSAFKPLKRAFVEGVPSYCAATRARQAVAVVDVGRVDQEPERVAGLLIRQGAALVRWQPLSIAAAGGASRASGGASRSAASPARINRPWVTCAAALQNPSGGRLTCPPEPVQILSGDRGRWTCPHS